MTKINTKKVDEILEKGNIAEASIATIGPEGDTTAHHFPEQIDKSFQCASLSKPVFSYLVLKLISANENKTAQPGLGKFKFNNKIQFDLDTPLYEVFRDNEGNMLKESENPFLKNFNDLDKAKEITAKMVLSHTSGLLITDEKPYKFQFRPGTQYAYSGPGIECLQEAIEELTGNTDIETLAQEHVFGEKALDMPNSSYGPIPKAANSLKTTAEEYLKFITAWINDPLLNYAFNPVSPANTMENDFFQYPQAKPELDKSFVKNVNVNQEVRTQVAWGLGVGLVKNNENEVIGTYHTGDSGEKESKYRAGFGALIDPKTKRCTEASIYLSKSVTGNGHMLADLILPEALRVALDYFFPTYGFARKPEELNGTNFHGLNPSILKDNFKEMALQTKISPSQEYKEKLQDLKSEEISNLESNSQEQSNLKI